ncbi:uncharacterized protein LOC144095040 [Amblyomma americanum]
MAWSELRAEKGLSCSAQACTSADAYDGSENADETSTMKKSRTCRMSFRGSHVGSLLSPCNCRGTIGLVHKECLEEWLSRRNTDECSICSYQFEVERPPISILDWIREPRRQGNLWCILVEMLLSLLGTILLLVSAFLFAVQAFSGISPVLGCVLTGIIMVLAGLMCIAHIYLMVCRHHRALMQWRHKWGVRLVLPNSVLEGAASVDARDVSPVPPSPPPSEPPLRRRVRTAARPPPTQTPQRQLP